MASDSDELAALVHEADRAHGASDDAAGESFDVLLQLTFPIVLILAFALLLLRHDLSVISSTPQAEVRRQMESLILELQKQLLAKAVQDTIAEEERAAQLSAYATSMPSPESIAAGNVDDRYRTLAPALYRRFNRPDRDLLPDLHRRAIDRYDVLAAKQPGLAGRPVSAANEVFLDTMLDGSAAQLIDRIVAIQQDLAFAWLRSEAAARMTRQQSRSIWNLFVSRRDESAEAMSRQQFNNLKLDYLRDEMARLGVPLLEKTLAGAL